MLKNGFLGIFLLLHFALRHSLSCDGRRLKRVFAVLIIENVTRKPAFVADIRRDTWGPDKTDERALSGAFL